MESKLVSVPTSYIMYSVEQQVQGFSLWNGDVVPITL